MHKTNLKKYLLSSFVIASLSLTSACGKAPQQQHGAMPVDIFEVVQKDVPVISHLSGRANPTRKAEVRPQVSGILQKRLFEEGAIVQQGQQLYQIDPSIYENNVKSAKAAYESAKASLIPLKRKAERFASLLQDKAVSKQTYDEAEAAYLAAKAAVQSAEASLNKANIDLAYTKVYAPITGTISRSNITEGALVSAGQVTPLTTIQQLDPIYVDLGQTAEEYIALRQNLTTGKLLNDGKAKVSIFFSNGIKYKHEGTVEFTEVSVDETTGMVNLRAIVPNPEHVILPGIFIRAEINQGITPNALLVTAEGIIREANGTTYAYIVDEKGLVAKQKLELGGQIDNNTYVVLKGLKVGDKVITSNTQKIRVGVPVTPIDAKMKAAMQQQQMNQQKK